MTWLMMKKKNWLFVKALLVMGVGLLFTKATWLLPKDIYLKSLSQQDYQNTMHSSIRYIDAKPFINKDSFYQTISRHSTYEELGQVVGGILPHHDVAAYMMADFYHSVSKVYKPEVIFLIGPNHYRIGERCQVGLFHFNTHTGTLSGDEAIAMQLLQYPNIHRGQYDVFKNEHAITIHMNFINYYFDDVTVIPLILNETNERDDLLAIAESIRTVTQDKQVLYVASVDFSHYLSLEEAYEKDQLTESLILTENTEQLITLSDDYVDCPSAVTLLIETLKQEGLNSKVFDHSNSAIIMKQPNLKETTSYFSIIYNKY